MRRFLTCILLAILAVSAIGCGSAATEVVPVSAKPRMFDTLDELIGYSTLVVTGEVTKVLPARHIEKSSVPITEIVFTVDQVLKGQVDTPTLRVYQLGGRLGDKDYQVENVRYYEKGERLVLFLEYAVDGLYSTTSVIQGEHRLAESDQVQFSGKNREELTIPQLKERAGKVPDRSRKAPKS